jgi:predicted dehydrogenase
MASTRNYALDSGSGTKTFPAPELPYQPPTPRKRNRPIGLIGCGGIAEQQLEAYADAGFNVVALSSRDPRKANALRRQFFPLATVYSDYRKLLEHDGLEVVDVTTHVDFRPRIIEAAIQEKKHVLSQKPFVLDLDEGQKLVQMATRAKVKLAVNQNARWAPHYSYIRHAIEKGLIGEVTAVHFGLHWDHNWVAGSPFDEMRHLILFDFGIHWFDLALAFLPDRRVKRVFASAVKSSGQQANPPLLAQALVEMDGAQASLVFDGSTSIGQLDETIVIGTKGTLRSTGPDLSHQTVTITTDRGTATPVLTGKWFNDAFRGTMGELLLSIDQQREPHNNAADNLNSVALTIAACRSVQAHLPQVPGKVRRLKL